MKSIFLTALFSLGFSLQAADFTYNPEFTALRKFASVKKRSKPDAQFEKCKVQSQNFARAAFTEMFAPQKRTVSYTNWLVGGHPSVKGADPNDPATDPNRYVMEVGIRSSSFKPKNADDKFEYSAFVMMDKKCEMVDTAKFISASSPEWDKFDMSDM